MKNVMDNEFTQELTNIEKFQPFVSLAIVSEEDAGYVSDCRNEVKARLKEIERIRTYLKEPVLEQGRRIDEQAKVASLPFQAIVRSLDQKLVAWHLSQEQIRIEAEKKRREEELARLSQEKEVQLTLAMMTDDTKAGEAISEIEKNVERLERSPLSIVENTRTQNGTTYLQKTWAFRIVDLGLIPREFLIPDEVAIGKIVRASKGDTCIPGIEVYEKTGIGGRKS